MPKMINEPDPLQANLFNQAKIKVKGYKTPVKKLSEDFIAWCNEYCKNRNVFLAKDHPYLLTEYEDFLNLDYRKKK